MNYFIRKLLSPAKSRSKNTVSTVAFGLLLAGAILIGGNMFAGGSMIPSAHAWFCSPGSWCSSVTTVVNVVNTGGGTAIPSNFQLTLTDESSGTYYGDTYVFAGSASGTTKNIDPEQYQIRVTSGPANYSVSYSSDCATTIANGESKTCTVTETYVPPVCAVSGALTDSVSDANPQVGETITYTLSGGFAPTAPTTIAVTDALGSGLTFVSANATIGTYSSSTGIWSVGTLSSAVSGQALTITAKVNTGTEGTTIYNNPTISYVQSSCTQSQAVTGVSIKIQSAVVTPATSTLIIVTNVTNDNLGVKTASDFSDIITGTNVLPSSTVAGSASGTTVTFTAGSFSVAQAPSAGYDVSYSADCSGTIAAGQTKTCTITDNDKSLPVPACGLNGLYGHYYNLPETLPGMEGTPTGVTSTNPVPADYSWWTSQFFSFASNTPITSFNQTSNFFPVNDGLAGDPFYTAIHWTGWVTFPASGTYPINLGSDDDSWLYINGQLVVANPGIHALTYATSSYAVGAGKTVSVDLYFAERHTVQSGIVFQMPGVTFSPCAPTSTPSADLSVSKTADVTSTTEGNTVHYTVSVTDLGPATSTGVVATDTLPSGLTFVSASTSAGSYASSTGTWTIGDLSASSTATLIIAAKVKTGTASSTITNTATVGGSASTTDPNTANNSSSVSIFVAPNGTPLPATIVATKIICPSVSDLPYLSGMATDITSSTAASFILAHPECHLASGWQFQWGNSNVSDPNVGGDFIGSAPTSTGWNTFGPTGSNGQATVQIANPTSTSNLWVREDLQSGYIPFSFYPGHAVNSTTSAEMFCHTDVLNYDNYDRVDAPAAGGTYYCVAWNVPTAPTSTPVADLSIAKTVDNTNPSEGNTVHYTVSVTDLGPATSTGVVATDTLPSGLTFVSASTSAGSYASSTGTWTIGDLSASSTATLVLTATVNTGTANTTITNTATVGGSASTTDPNTANNSSSVAITVAGGGGGGNDADIAITKTADATSTVEGGVIHYTVTVTAHGPQASTGVVATDTLPSGLTFGNATASVGSYASSTGTWTIGTLMPNATATLDIAAQVNAGTSGTTITNDATVGESSTLTDPIPGNNSASVSVSIGSAPSPTDADIAITKTVDNANPAGGATINFTVTVTDNGPATSTFVDAHDQLPIGLSMISATTSQGTYNLGTGDWTIGTLGPNASATLTYSATVGTAYAGQTITNTASVSQLSSLVDPDPANNSSSIAINVQPAGCTSNCGGGGGGGGNTPSAEIGIVKTVDNAAPATGSTIHYTLTVSAIGPAASFGVVADDLLPAGVTFDSASSSAGSYVSSTGVWTIGTMSAGQAATLVLTATVTAANGTAITNTGTVSESRTVNDPLSGNNSSSVTINVGGGGGGGGGGQILGASTSTGQVLGASCGLYLTSYIHPIRKDLNDPAQVKKLQIFLNQNLGLDLPVDGYYGDSTIAAVNRFQVKYHTEVLAPWLPLGLPTEFTPTSYVYQTTQRWINLIMCPPLNLPLPALKVDTGK